MKKGREINSYQTTYKRLFDLLGVVILAPLWVPLLVFISSFHFFLVKSPLCFFQERLGESGRVFTVYKLKTLENDKDISRWTRFLRMSHLDELPQLINIIKGDMSFIGPRPLLKIYYPYFTPEELNRFNVKPGITGLAQVHGGNELSWDKRLALDVLYIKEIAFITDLAILLKTIKVMVNLDTATSVSLIDERGCNSKFVLQD